MVNSTNLTDKVLTLVLGEDIHAISIAKIEEVLPALPIESVPNSPSFVQGVIVVRGELIPVLAAAERLGLAQHHRVPEPKIVCVRVGRQLIGVEFDDAVDVVDISDATLLDASAIDCSKGFFTGVVDLDGSIIRMLDPEFLLNVREAGELGTAT